MSTRADAAATEALPTRADDRVLADAIGRGERGAFEQLMRRHNRHLYRVARATLRDTTEAEDALQEAYIAAYRSIASFRGDSSVRTWLTRLVLNECFARLRRSARRDNVVPIVACNDEVDASVTAESAGPDQMALRAEMRQLLERKIDALPESFRVVFVLRSVEEMTVEEVAEALGIPEATVRSRHFRAKSLLREALAQEIDLAERDVFEFGGERCDRIVAEVVRRIEQS